MKSRMIVTKEFRPKGSGGPMARVGDLLTVDETQRRAWEALNWVKEAPPEEDHSFTYHYDRRDMEADDAAPEPAAKKVAAKKTKRTYTRRNLTAK